MTSRVLRRREIPTEVSTIEGLSPLLARLLAARGIAAPSDFDLSMAGLLHPDGLKGIDAAATLLAGAVREQQRILVVGDFDADGATSSALVLHALRSMGAAQVDYLVPNRFEFGYGLTPAIVDVATRFQPELIITVDNGIASVEGVQHARSLGMKVLVTDHHLAPDVLPAADAIVNPNQPGCTFASKALAGVGVAFYLVSATRRVLQTSGWFDQRPLPNLAEYLDLVALGTIADVVPLDRNNRILVNEGIRRIRAGRARPGIQALMQVAGINPALVTSQRLAFGVSPRLNAAGRLEDMSVGIECLLSDDLALALTLAEQLDELNRARRDIEQQMKDEAFAALKKLDTGRDGSVGLTLYDPGWHQGVVGIVASRVKERVHRPVIAFARASAQELKGSGRSIPGLHIRDALDAIATRHPGLLNKFGGHAMAAGLSLAPENLEAFTKAFDDEARRQLGEDDLEHRVVTDGELDAPLTLPLVREICMAAPWGQGFPEPVFDAEFEIIDQRIVGERHLKLKLRKLDDETVLDAIAFNEDRLIEGRRRRIAYRVDVNEYRGLQSVQLIIECLNVRA